MRKKLEKVVRLMMLLMLLMCMSITAHAAKPYMKQMGVSWDLKPNKQITYKNAYGGIGLQNEYAKIVKYKKTSVGNRYKLTLKIKFECIKTLEQMSTSKRDAFLEYSDGEGCLGDYNVVVADYMTGKSLYAYNKYGVNARCNYKTFREKEFESSDGDYYESFVNSYATVTITYPKSYKNLCIGVGGSTSWFGGTEADEDYYDGYGSFKRTSFNSPRNKRVMHFMRVK